jgi:hypothetical protein
MSRRIRASAVMLFPAVVSLACAQSNDAAGQPTYTKYPTYTAYPTFTTTGDRPQGDADANTPVSGNRIIPDLSYIKILAVPYTDDADQESEGISLNIEYYDSKSKTIPFSGVPLEVAIEFIGYKNVFAAADRSGGETVYQTTVSMDHSMRLEEVFGKYIWIPFSDMNVDPQKIYQLGSIVVTVTTPAQGSFVSDYDLPVQLYP